MGKLIIITGPQGCGKTTFAWKNYRGSQILEYSEREELKRIKKIIKNQNITVVCCLPIDCKDLIPENTNQQYQIITLNSKGEVAQICGRGFLNDEVAEGCSNFWKKNIEDFAKQFTNEQQLQFHRQEAERIEKLIEEENKPKVGDWVTMGHEFFKIKEGQIPGVAWKKVTNPQLIILLENECRESL